MILDAAGGLKNRPFTTAFAPAFQPPRLFTCPLTFPPRYPPPWKLVVRRCVFNTFPFPSRMSMVCRRFTVSQSRQYKAIWCCAVSPMFRSIVNSEDFYHAAAILLVELDGFCNPRTSVVEPVHTQVS